MRMPEPRGAASGALFEALVGHPENSDLTAAASAVDAALQSSEDILTDDDLQVALFVLYELHYRGVEGVDEAWEWYAGLLGIRHRIEQRFEARLREVCPVPELPEASRKAVADTLFAMAEADTSPSVSRFVATKATDEQVHDLLKQRSIYQLKEADPHTWAIPRLEGDAKAALVEIQADEYGSGIPGRIHSQIFARTMQAMGLDAEYGAYIDDVAAITLASANLMSLFGLHRRLRGAIVGHLAAYEITSSIPSRLYGNGFRRLGYDESVTYYFDEHVEADAVHEQIAARNLAGGLVESDPTLLGDVLFGASASLTVDGMMGAHILECWARGESSLRSEPERSQAQRGRSADSAMVMP